MKRRKGMTLIEVIVAMAVIGIVAVSVLSVFTTGFGFIMLAGSRSDAGFNTHGRIEGALNQRNTSETPSNIVITFTSDDTEIIAPGNIEVFSQPIRTGSVEIEFFQPRY